MLFSNRLNAIPHNTRKNILLAFEALSAARIMADEFNYLIKSSLVKATLDDIEQKWNMHNIVATRAMGLYQRFHIYEISNMDK